MKTLTVVLVASVLATGAARGGPKTTGVQAVAVS